MSNLFVYVEGFYDKLFVDMILSEILLQKFSIKVFPIPYARKNNNQINKDIRSKQYHDYLFFSDLDSDLYPCITSRKDKRISEYAYLDSSKIIIVKEEIESWFLAGIDTSLEQFKSINVPDNTDSITKEDFGRLLDQNSIDDKTSFLVDVSRNFDLNLASKRNASFSYFLNKIGLVN